MLSILRFLRDRILTRDPSNALFAAGVKAWKDYEETGQSQYLAEAVRNHQAALDIRLPDHSGRLESLLQTAMALWAQCNGAATKERTSTVIAYYDEALRLLLDKPGNLGRRATICTKLGMVYFTLFRLGKEDSKAFPATGSNIGKAIEKSYRSALQLGLGKKDPDRPILYSKDDLMNAIINLREALELCTTNRPLLLLALNSLGQAYDSHYHYSATISDVVGKVDVRLVSLVSLTNAVWRLCEIEHNKSNNLDEAVLRGREALKLSDGFDNIIRGRALIALADVLSARYVHTRPRNVTDLDQAIQYYREAIDLYSEDGPDPILCSGLASAIYIRCQDFEEVEGATLEDAISYNQQALHTCRKDEPLYVKIQNSLWSIYLTQSEVDVEGIQALYEDIVSHCPDDNVDVGSESELRRPRSVASSLHSTESSDESYPSTPASESIIDSD